MQRTNFETLDVYRLAEKLADAIRKIKPIVDELAPRLNAYLKSVGNASKLHCAEEATDHGQLTTDD